LHDSSCLDNANVEVHLESSLDRAKNGGQVVHPRVATRRQHPMQALDGLVSQHGERVKANRCVHEVSQDEASCIGLPI